MLRKINCTNWARGNCDEEMNERWEELKGDYTRVARGIDDDDDDNNNNNNERRWDMEEEEVHGEKKMESETPRNRREQTRTLR